MDFYFDTIDFEKKLQTVFDEFCRENNLVLYQGNDIFFLDTKNPKPSYLGNLSVSYNPTYLLSNLTGKSGNDWSKCKIPEQYKASFVEKFYTQMDVPNTRYLRVLNKYFSKIVPPELIAGYLSIHKPTLLEDFLTVPKMSSSNGWSGEQIFSHLEKLFIHKSESGKTTLLKETLKNNKIMLKDFSFQETLKNFIELHIAPEQREEVLPFYRTMKKTVEEGTNIFNKPSNTFLLEINKIALNKKIKFQRNQAQLYEGLIKSLGDIFNSKKIAIRFHVDSLIITQKTEKFKNYRLNFNGLPGKKINEERLIDFIGLFLEAYSNSFSLATPKKEDLIEMARKLVLSFELNKDLEEKDTNYKKNKI